MAIKNTQQQFKGGSMNKKLQVLGLMIIAGCIMSSNLYADQNYQDRNVFNRFTDWTATIGKSPEEKERIINERVDMRAKNRQAWDHKRGEEGKMQSRKDGENKDYERRRSDLQNQYKDDPDTMNKKLREAENDHNSKMHDLDSQEDSSERK
jgi:hypothetical protein